MRYRLFEGLPETVTEQILGWSRRRSFTRGEVVFHRGDPADTLHLVSSVRFAVRTVTELGASVMFAVLLPGDFFGELSLLRSDAHRTATVAALEPSETRTVRRADLLKLRAERPAVEAALLEALVQHTVRLSERLVEALHVPAEQRVLRRLHELSPSPNTLVELTQEELAELAGTSRATVNRVLREQERAGILQLVRGGTVVIDPDGLDRAARPWYSER